MGIVITTFFIFILILLPLSLFMQELKFYQITNHSVQVATELSCFDMVLELSSEALSENMLFLDAHMNDAFMSAFNENTDLDLTIQMLDVKLDHTRLPKTLSVYFEYPYESQIFLARHLTKTVVVKLNYELPLNN